MPSHSSITVPGFGEVPVVALGTVDGGFGTAGFGSDDEEPIFLSPIQRRLRERGGLFGFGGGTLSMLHSLAFSGLGTGLGLRSVSGSGTATGRNAPNSSLGGGNNSGLSGGNTGSLGGGVGGGASGSHGTLPQPRSLGLLDLHNRVSDLVRVRTPARRSVTSNSSDSTTEQLVLTGRGQDVRPLLASGGVEDRHGDVDENEDSDTEDDGVPDVCEDEDEALDYMDVDEAGEDEEYGEDDFDMEACDSDSYEAESVEASAARSLDNASGRRRPATTEGDGSCSTDSEASRYTLPASECASDGGEPLGCADGYGINGVCFSEEEEPLLAAHRAAEAQGGEQSFPEGAAELQSNPATQNTTQPGVEADAEIGRASGDNPIDATARPPLHPASDVAAIRAAYAADAAPGLAPGPRRRDSGTLSLAWAAARFALSAMLVPVRFVMYVAGLSSDAIAMSLASRILVTVASRPADRTVAPHSDGPAAAAGSGPSMVSGAHGQAGWRWRRMRSTYAGQEQGDGLNAGTFTDYGGRTRSSSGDNTQIIADTGAGDGVDGSVRYRATTGVAAAPTSMAPTTVEPMGLPLPAFTLSQGLNEHDEELAGRSARDQSSRRLENRNRHVQPVVLVRGSPERDAGNAVSRAPSAGAVTPPLPLLPPVSSAGAPAGGEQAAVSNPPRQLHPLQHAALPIPPFPLLYQGTLLTAPVPREGFSEAQVEPAVITVEATPVADTDDDEETAGLRRDTAPACTAAASGTGATRSWLPGLELMRLPALDLALNQLMRERVPGSVAAPVTTASAMAAEQRSRSAVGSCWRQVVHHSGCAEADASGRVVAAAEATGPRNAIDLDAEADEGSLSSTSGSDADVRVWGGRQLLNAEQLLSLVASSGPAPGPGNLHGPGEPGSGAAVPEIEFARPSAARTLGLRNGASNETGEDARPWTHCVAGLSSLNGRPRPFGTPRALLGMTNSVSGQNRRQRPRHPGGLSHGDHVSTAPRDLGAGAQGGTDVAAAAGAAARLPLLLWGNRFSNPEFTERLQRLLMRRAASMENGRSDAEHYPVWAMPAPATAAASGPRVSQARQSMASPAAPPLSAATLASSPLRAPPAASFEPRLLRLPNTELGVTALNMLSGPTPRPSVGQRVTAAAGMSNGGADVRPLLASAAGAVTAAAASGSPGSGLWGDRYDEEEWQRPIMAMQDDTGDLPAIGATTLQSAFQSEDEGGAPTSNPAHMGGLRGASNRLGQLRASSLFEGRRRVQRRQQRAGRQAWQEHSTDSHVLDSNYSSDGSSGLCHYYYSDGNTDHRALVNQLNPSARVPLVDLVFPRIGTLPSSGGSSMLGTRHVGSPAQVMGNPMSTSLMEAPWGVRHMDLPQRRSRSSLGGLGAGHPRDDSAASASWENPSKHRPTQLAGSGEVGSSSGSTVSTSSEMPDLVSDSDSSPEWEWPHVEHQPQRPTLWRQRRHGLIGPALLGLPPGFVPLAAVDCSGLSMGTWSGVMNRRARATYTSQEEDADADTQSPTGFSSDFHTAREGSPAVAAALQMMVTEGSDNAASLPQAVADAGPSASGWRANTDPPGVSSDPEERSNNTPYSRLVMPRCFAQMDVGSNADTCSNADSELEEIAARLSHPVASVSRELRNSEAVACGDELPRLVVPNARGAAAGEGISPEPALSVSPSEAIVPESDSVFADVANVDAWAQSPPELIVGDNSHGEYSSWHSLASSRRSLRQRLGSQVALPDAVDAAGLIARTVAQECMDRSEAFGGPSSRRPQHIEHEDVRARLAWPFSDADGCTSDGSDLPTYWWASPRDRQPIEGICFPGSARNAGSPDRGGVEEDLGSIEMPPSSCSTDEDIEANGTVAAADGDSSDGDLLPPALVDREDEEALPPALVDSEDEEALPPALVDSEDEEALPPALVDSEETSAPDDESEGQSTVPFLIHEDRSSTSTGNDGNGDSRPMEGGSIADESDGQLQVARDLWVDEEYEQDYGDRGNTPSFSNRRHWVTGERVFGHSVSSEMDSDNGLPDVLSSSELEPFLHSRADRGQAGGGIGTAHVNPIAALSTLSPNSLARSQPDSRAISIPSGNRQLLQSSTRLPPIGSTVAASHSRTYALPGVTPAGIRSESAGASSLSVYRRMAEQMYLETTTFAPSDQDGGTANSDISSDSMPPLVSLNSPHSGSRGSSGRSSLADNDAYEPRTSGPAVVRRRRAWAEYQGFPSSQRQQDASLPFAAGTTATVTATEPAPPRSLRGSPPAPSQRTANVSTSVTGTTDELTSTETDSTWGAAVEALLRVLIDVRSGDRVSAGAGGSVASRAARSVSGSIAHMPTTTATLNGPQPHPIAAGNGAGSSSANGSGNSSRVGPPSQIVASLVRIPADVLSNVPPGSVLSITIPAGGLSSSIRGGSSNISLGGSGGGSRPGSNTTAARILQLGALSSFPLSWRSYLPAEENSGRHPNDYPGLPGIYDERDIPPWAARFAPRVPPELPTLRDTTAGSDSGGAQQVAVSSETRTTQADVQQDANVVEDNSTYQMRSMPASWEAQWDDFSFSTADEDDGDDNTSTNYMEANRDVEERNCQAAGDSEGQQCDTESLPDSLPDLLPLEESPAATESSAAARLRGLRDPALPEMTAANASGREMALPPPNNASQGELPPRQYFVEMLAGMEPPVRRVDRRDGEGNVGRESGGAAAQAVSLDDARAAAYHLHSAAAHMPHELQHLQDGSRDRSPAPIDVPGAGEATGTRERRVAAPDLVGSGEGDCNVGVVEMLTELEGLPGLPPIELQRQLQQPDGRQPQLREHNSVGPVLQGAGEPLHPGAGVTAAMAVSDLHEGPESRHVRRGSAPARVPLPPMPEGAGAAPPQHSLVAGARGLNTVSRYAGPDMEDGNAEPESLLLGAVAVQETLPTAASEFGRGVVAARVAPGTAREPGSVPARRNAVTYPRSVLLDMLEALRSSETAASSSLVGSSHGSIMAAAAAHVPNATAATSMQMVGMGLGLHERATRSASHVAATAALLRDDSFVAQLLGGLPGVAISPPACCVQETVRMLQSGEEGAGMGSKMELCNLIID